MHFFGFLLLFLCQRLSRAFPAPVDAAIVQIQRWGVVGAPRVVDRVLLNGVSVSSTSPEVSGIIRAMSADAPLPAPISVNRTASLRNHTVLWSQECVLEGSRLHWSVRVFYDGNAVLTVERGGVRTLQQPEAAALKELLEKEARWTSEARERLQEGCVRLMRELKLSEERPQPGAFSGIPYPTFLIPTLALTVFVGLVLISFLAKNKDLRHPGGVVGSIIHYPKDLTDTDSETTGVGYRTL